MGTQSDLFFGLATALGYGTGDFLARQAAHRVGHFRVLFYMEAISLCALLPAALILESSAWHWSLAWGIVAGLGAVNVFASLFLYRSFEYGVLSVVSPLVSTYPAVTAGLAILFLGQYPGPLGSVGIVLALAGVVLISRSRAHPQSPQPRNARVGLISAILAFAGYGVFYFALEYVVSDTGPVSAAAIVRVVGVGILLAARGMSSAMKTDMPRDLWPTILAIGLLDTFAFVAYNVGIVSGSVAIIGTLSGLFSAVTVALATVVLRERLTLPQYAGMGSIFLGVALMAAA
ncbi:MAG TPA: DMT family transporter [Thermoplasmata archaeon]